MGDLREAVRNSLPASADAEFMRAWDELKAEGYQYSDDNIEKVHMGWIMAKNFVEPEHIRRGMTKDEWHEFTRRPADGSLSEQEGEWYR